MYTCILHGENSLLNAAVAGHCTMHASGAMQSLGITQNYKVRILFYSIPTGWNVFE